MKIAVNLFPFREKLAGAGKYAKNIISELVELDKTNQYYLFISKKGEVNFSFNKPNVNIITANFNPDSVLQRIFYEQVIFPFKLFKLKPELIFTPSVAVPVIYNGRFFTTIHDIAYKRIKNKYPLLRRIYVDLITKISFFKSEVIFTVSNFSKKELIEQFGKNKKIIVTYNAVDKKFFYNYDSIEKQKFREKYNLPQKYFLYVGAIEPGKKLDKLFVAFAELLKIVNSDIFLVITSAIRWKETELLKLIEKLNIKKNIVFLPYISEEELPLLYKCSLLLSYLSSYEGFGLPVLEAMAAGVPVVTSNSEAICEFSQNSTFNVQPDNINEIVDAFLSIIDNNSQVKEKIQSAVTVAKTFQWKNSAKIILEHFNNHNDLR